MCKQTSFTVSFATDNEDWSDAHSMHAHYLLMCFTCSHSNVHVCTHVNEPNSGCFISYGQPARLTIIV